jgi:hypothetical protein
MSPHRFVIAGFMMALTAIFSIDFIKITRNTKNKMEKLQLKAIFVAFFAISLNFPSIAVAGYISEAIFLWPLITFMESLIIYTENNAKGVIGPFVYDELKRIFKILRNLIDRSRSLINTTQTFNEALKAKQTYNPQTSTTTKTS